MRPRRIDSPARPRGTLLKQARPHLVSLALTIQLELLNKAVVQVISLRLVDCTAVSVGIGAKTFSQIFRHQALCSTSTPILTAGLPCL